MSDLRESYNYKAPAKKEAIERLRLKIEDLKDQDFQLRDLMYNLSVQSAFYQSDGEGDTAMRHMRNVLGHHWAASNPRLASNWEAWRSRRQGRSGRIPDAASPPLGEEPQRTLQELSSSLDLSRASSNVEGRETQRQGPSDEAYRPVPQPQAGGVLCTSDAFSPSPGPSVQGSSLGRRFPWFTAGHDVARCGDTPAAPCWERTHGMEMPYLRLTHSSRPRTPTWGGHQPSTARGFPEVPSAEAVAQPIQAGTCHGLSVSPSAPDVYSEEPESSEGIPQDVLEWILSASPLPAGFASETRSAAGGSETTGSLSPRIQPLTGGEEAVPATLAGVASERTEILGHANSQPYRVGGPHDWLDQHQVFAGSSASFRVSYEAGPQGLQQGPAEWVNAARGLACPLEERRFPLNRGNELPGTLQQAAFYHEMDPTPAPAAVSAATHSLFAPPRETTGVLRRGHEPHPLYGYEDLQRGDCASRGGVGQCLISTVPSSDEFPLPPPRRGSRGEKQLVHL